MRKLEKSSLSFFKFIRLNLGYHLYTFIIANSLVGFLDGLGLTLFIPLLTLISNENGADKVQSLGGLRYFIEFLNRMGISLTLVNVLLVMIGIFSLKGLVVYLKSLYDLFLRLSILKKIRYKLIDALSCVSYKRYTNYDFGKIQNTMTGQVDRLVNAMNNFFGFIQNIIMLSAYTFLAFVSNWKFAFLVILGGIGSNFLYKNINKATAKASREVSKVGDKFNQYLMETIHNYKYLKSTNYLKKYNGYLRNSIEHSQRLNYKIGTYSNIMASTREPIIIGIIVAVIIIQVEVLGGSFASILVSLFFFYRALNYLSAIQGSWNAFIANSAGYTAITEVLDDFHKHQELPQKSKSIQQINTIDLKNISLKYDNQTILNNVSLSIGRKQSIALVGESGAGKTTLANIICGLLAPDSGEIFINQEVFGQEYVNELRNKVGYITQDSVIFNDNIFNNITFWDEKTPENLSKFWKCIQLVSLESFINNLEHKEDTMLGNNGILVSGGQKQRISIARELYKNVELLIMDEATSALDSETENYIKENIERLQGEYMMVIIAHRLSTIKHVDCIFLLEKGKIVDSGSFEYLLSNNQHFKKMVELQTLNK